MAGKTSELSVSQPEDALQKKKSLLATLKKQRDRAIRDLKRVETRIASIEGTSSQSKRRRLPRRRNEKPLTRHVIEILEADSKGLALGEIVEQVLKAGYKSSSDNFSNVVYQALYNNTITHDKETGNYQLKKTPAPSRKTSAKASNAKPSRKTKHVKKKVPTSKKPTKKVKKKPTKKASRSSGEGAKAK